MIAAISSLIALDAGFLSKATLRGRFAPRRARRQVPGGNLSIDRRDRCYCQLKIASYLDAGGIDAEILVVDDGSKDRTAELATKALAGRRGRVVANGENRGKGYSVRHGVLEARGRFVLLTDADLSTSIEDHARLAQVMRDRDVDVVIGSRALPGSSVEIRQGRVRETMGRSFNVMIRFLTGLPSATRSAASSSWTVSA